MEGFNDLLLKLREVHEREVEGWQVKVQELSNKKGCDTKRMEELFSRNQQMKEQQRLLTENIKTLENRLRAGLCDRCTVTQEVAKKRQQEYEASQIQSLQHISMMAGEMSNLKKDNKRLRDELRSLRAALDRGHRDHSSNTSATTEVKSPDLSPSPIPVALITAATNSVGSQSGEGNGAVKADTDQRSEEAEHRQIRGMNRSHFEPFKPFPLSALTLQSRKIDHTITHVGEKRAPSAEGLDQRPRIPPHSLLLKRSSPSGEVNPTRHVLHAPVPCRPQPIKGSSLTLPWPLSESCDWANVAAASASMVLQPSLKSNLPRYPNLIPTSQHASSRRQVFGQSWHKQTAAQPHIKEPTVVFRLKSLEDHRESQSTPQEKKEVPAYKVEKTSTWQREAYEGPLDLSDRAKPKSGQTPRGDSPLTIQDAETVRRSPDKDVKANLSPHVRASSSPSAVIPSLSSCTPPVKQQEEEASSEECENGKAEGAEKKVPVLTISLRPVVVLETLNSTLQKQESMSSNGKTLSPAVEPGSSSDEVECVSGQESSQSCKRKRSAAEPEADRHSDTDNARKHKITVRSEEKSPS